jgi:hypothetical protein
MAVSKCAPEGEAEPSHKCAATDLEIKIRMLCNYKGQQSLSSIACELGFAVSTSSAPNDLLNNLFE